MEEQKQKTEVASCPYCGATIKTVKGENTKCDSCGANVSYEAIKNEKAIIQTTNDGKKKFNFQNLIKRWWFWVVSAVIILAIIGAVMPKTPTTVYEKNQTVSVNNVSITIQSVTDTQRIDSISDFTTSNYYLIVLVKLTNNKSTDYYASSSDFKVYYNGHTYSQLPTESYWYGENAAKQGLSYGVTVKSGLAEEAYLVFEVPQSANSANYILSFKPSTTEIQIKLY